MRLLFVAAACAALSGCMTSAPPPPPAIPMGFNPEHDAYCKSLLMPPGSLVYIQCRLAMSQTQRKADEQARAVLTQDMGFVSPETELAMRDDVFCNFNESAKLSVESAVPSEAAFSAANRCRSTRTRLERTLREGNPMQAETAIASYSRVALATNEATIAESRAFH